MAVGFSLKNIWQLTPRNNLSSLAFHPSVSAHTHLALETVQTPSYTAIRLYCYTVAAKPPNTQGYKLLSLIASVKK